MPRLREDFQRAQFILYHERDLLRLILIQARDIQHFILGSKRGINIFGIPPYHGIQLASRRDDFPRLPRVLSEVFCSKMETSELLIP
jgi:hypothetical protein